MSTVSIIGAGNLAWVFGQRLKSRGYEIREVCSRNEKTGKELSKLLGSRFSPFIKKLDGKSDLYLLAVNDGAISESMRLIPSTQGLVIHFSGSTSLHVLTHPFRAVLWPLESISKSTDPDWKSMNIIMESDSDLASIKALDLIQDLGAKAVQMDEQKRKQAHLIAVILNNFSNHLIHMAEVISNEHGIDRRIFKGLLSSALTSEVPAKQMQTGPAVRGDKEITAKQLAMLSKHPDFQNVYKAMSESIYNASLK